MSSLAKRMIKLAAPTPQANSRFYVKGKRLNAIKLQSKTQQVVAWLSQHLENNRETNNSFSERYHI